MRFSMFVASLALVLAPASAGPAPSQAPRVVAVLETRAPVLLEFLVRGTVPIPAGVYPRADGRNPFTILDFDGTPRQTQVEVVSRYPEERDGADVVEVLARVRRDPALAIGAPARYSVVLRPALPAPAGDFMPDEVRTLLFDADGLEISSHDCFGNRYVSRPFGDDQPFELLRRGPVQAEARVHENMLPEPGSSGALPHLLGVHSYVSWFQNSPLVGLDLRFHNAQDGHDAFDPRDDALGKVYFREIELSLPLGWTVQQDFADPLFGGERIEGGRRIVSLVAPEPGGRLHVMRWQGQFHRRLVLAPAREGAQLGARALLDGAGRAVVVRGADAAGDPYWSWWNRATARYFPQRCQLPSLDHVGRATLEAQLGGELGMLVGFLASGTGTGEYPVSSGRLGWGHPYGVSYGGMTSGLEIDMYDGVEAAAVAGPLGFRLYSLLHRMQSDRQPNALYQLDGNPSSVDEWRIENGDADYIPFEHFVVPLLSGSQPDAFGLHMSPDAQRDFVQANGLQPGYEGPHLAFDPHDYQHFVRYTRSAKVLAWLANDSLAKDDLCMQAENFHLSFHELFNNANGGLQSSGMRRMQAYVAQHPGKGFPFGRGEGWGIDCATAAYSLAGRAPRERMLPWFRSVARLLSEGQASCSGFIQALVSNKAVNGKYQARQAIEQSITEHALGGLHESVFREADPGYASMVRDVLEDSLYAFISEMSWFPGEFGPWRYTGVGPLDPDLPVWCMRSEMPSDAWTAGDIETYQDWSSLAYGFELTGDNVFLRFARIQIGGVDFEDLVARMQASGTNNLGNRTALLALLQRMTGVL
jgi:hypothetical protein